MFSCEYCEIVKNTYFEEHFSCYFVARLLVINLSFRISFQDFTSDFLGQSGGNSRETSKMEMTAPFSFAGRPKKMKRYSGKYLEDTIYGLRIIF